MIYKKKFSCERDKMTIRGTMYYPEGDNLKIAIISHGFMANMWTTKKYAKWFAKQGYMAICFDFNGGCLFGKSNNDTTKMTIYTEVSDLKTVIKFAKTLPNVNKNSVTLMGCSQGALVSAITATSKKEKIEKLILFYPALCIADDARRGELLFSKYDPNNIPDIIKCGPMKLGKKFAEVIMDVNLIDEIKNYDKNVLIVHGDADKIVDLSYAKEAHKKYKNSVLKIIKGGKHMFNRKHDKLALDYVKEFIK